VIDAALAKALAGYVKTGILPICQQKTPQTNYVVTVFLFFISDHTSNTYGSAYTKHM